MSIVDPVEEVIIDAVDDFEEAAGVGGEDAEEEVEDLPVEEEEVVKTSEVEEEPEVLNEVSPDDKFSKRFGLASKSSSGRENRIPYSRVRKIIEKNEREVEKRVREAISGEMNPKVTEFETKVKDYEERLLQVGQFEDVMEKDPKRMLTMLSNIPAYKPFFDKIRELSSPVAGAERVPVPGEDAPPEPNITLKDGSKSYDLEGLQRLLDWQDKRTSKRVMGQVETTLSRRYGPMEQAYNSREQLARQMPAVNAQIAEAQTWDRWTDVAARVEEILGQDQAISLDRAYNRAYQEIVVPRQAVDRNQMRTEILAEVKRKPVSTSTRSKVSLRASDDEPMTVEDIIRREIAKLEQ